MNQRVVTTCFGRFRIEGDIAVSCADDQHYYYLPHAEMTNDEIKDYFRILMEEDDD